MITKEKFQETVEFLQKRMELEGKIEILCHEYDFYTENRIISGDMYDKVIELLMIAANDVYEWTEWFIYENDFGKNHMMCLAEDGNDFYVDTVNDVWKMIVTGVK